MVTVMLITSMMIMIAMTKHDLDCGGCKKGLILGTRRLKSEVIHTSLVKRTLLLVMIVLGEGNEEGDDRKALGFGESHSQGGTRNPPHSSLSDS